MITITDKAIDSIKRSNRLIARLMIVFDRGQNTIENWLASKDVRLTTPMALAVIKEESGLEDHEILVDDSAMEPVGKES